jgi:hypothetical protein
VITTLFKGSFVLSLPLCHSLAAPPGGPRKGVAERKRKNEGALEKGSYHWVIRPG